MSRRATFTIPFYAGLLLCMTISGGLRAWAGAAEAKKDKAPRKGSEAIRKNPLIRNYFRQRALSMQPSLQENGRSINTTVDYLLDDFVERSVRLAQKLGSETEELYALARLHRTAGEPNETAKGVVDHNLREKTRAKAEAIKNVTKSLEGQMDFIIQALHLTLKVNEAPLGTPEPKQVERDIANLHNLVAIFKKDLNEFLFPKTNTVSLEDLQKSALPVQLKRIERYAERIEIATKRMR